MNKRAFLTTVAASFVLAAASVGHAQEAYPSRPVRLVVPFPPGGTSDMMGRLIADELGALLKQPVVVDNKAGAGGAIGTTEVARAPADGYTLLLSGTGTNAIMHGLSPKPSYDSVRDFAHVSQLVAGPNVLVVHPSFPAKTFKEFLAYAKANPGKVSYGMTHASTGHLTTEYLKQVAGLDMAAIPYRGGALAVNDLLGNQIPMMFTNQDAAYPHVKAGKLRVLAISSATRSSLYPDVPTVAESGYPEFAAVAWVGLSAPRGTPQAVLDKLESAMVTAFRKPATRAKLESAGWMVVASSSADYTAFVKKEMELWTGVIRSANIKPE